MKNRWIFFIVIPFILSMGKTVDKHYDLKKKWKTYQHKDFSFQYPKDWKRFTSDVFENEKRYMIVRVAPKKKIVEVRKAVAVDSLYDNAPFLRNEKNDDVNLNAAMLMAGGRTFKYTDHSDVQFNVSIEPFLFSNMEEFIHYRKGRIAKEKSVEGYFKKLDDNHYVNYLRIYLKPKAVAKPNEIQDNILHYYRKDGKLYTLVFMTTLAEDDTNKQTALQIFYSFKFLNP